MQKCVVGTILRRLRLRPFCLCLCGGEGGLEPEAWFKCVVGQTVAPGLAGKILRRFWDIILLQGYWTTNTILLRTEAWGDLDGYQRLQAFAYNFSR